MAKELIAMILAGGKGTRLEALTTKIAKPAVSYGGKYRIIDFPLSNCANTGIDVVGVLTQYESVSLNTYIGNGEKWGLNGVRSLTTPLPPRQTEEGLSWYAGTADAIYQNIEFIDEIDPTYILILSGDHIYSTTYTDMLALHKQTGAECTISVIEVDPADAPRFGILVTDENGNITEFQEKPKKPKSFLASMGVYIFTYKALRKYLIEDHKDETSEHDFGKNIIPKMLDSKKKMVAYKFHGYWKDVGTILSLHQANMDLLSSTTNTDVYDMFIDRTIFSEDTNSTPQYIGRKAKVRDSIINQGAVILGSVESSVISNEVYIEEGAKVFNSVIMPNVLIKKGASVKDAIVAPNSLIEENQIVEPVGDCKIVLISNNKNKEDK